MRRFIAVRWAEKLKRLETAGARETALPVAILQGGDTDALPRGRGVYKLAVTNIDTDVRVTLPLLVKKQQIATPKLIRRYIPCRPKLVFCISRYFQAGQVVAVLNQPAAIEAFAGAIAAVMVVSADHLLRIRRSAFTVNGITVFGLCRRTGATGEYRDRDTCGKKLVNRCR